MMCEKKDLFGSCPIPGQNTLKFFFFSYIWPAVLVWAHTRRAVIAVFCDLKFPTKTWCFQLDEYIVTNFFLSPIVFDCILWLSLTLPSVAKCLLIVKNPISVQFWISFGTFGGFQAGQLIKMHYFISRFLGCLESRFLTIRPFDHIYDDLNHPPKMNIHLILNQDKWPN